jgi:hypothetical protein
MDVLSTFVPDDVEDSSGGRLVLRAHEIIRSLQDALNSTGLNCNVRLGRNQLFSVIDQLNATVFSARNVDIPGAVAEMMLQRIRLLSLFIWTELEQDTRRFLTELWDPSKDTDALWQVQSMFVPPAEWRFENSLAGADAQALNTTRSALVYASLDAIYYSPEHTSRFVVTNRYTMQRRSTVLGNERATLFHQYSGQFSGQPVAAGLTLFSNVYMNGA